MGTGIADTYLFVFVIYLKLLQVFQTKQRHMVEFLAKNELERICKEAVVAYFRYHSGIFLDRLTKNHVKLQENRCPVRDSNQAPPEYKPEVLLLEPICFGASLNKSTINKEYITEMRFSNENKAN
jgi:hypothetical protein